MLSFLNTWSIMSYFILFNTLFLIIFFKQPSGSNKSSMPYMPSIYLHNYTS